ncbi:hypothetical protein ABEV54_11675 [Peribacillus psychrosaccharolyticus]|nr:hypothetical protein [Peribacillus psychrosaccharolyticus]MEC2053921.1 hypothetical protein [Peribacillus psychrosaccharolyticus]MED3742465.1 hypothetical protein [Peribacillus psychrosaccharolyticus]
MEHTNHIQSKKMPFPAGKYYQRMESWCDPVLEEFAHNILTS